MMKWTRSKSLLLTKLVIIFFLILLGVGAIYMPQILRWYMNYSGQIEMLYNNLLILVYCCIPPAALALLAMLRLINNVSKDRVFTAENVKMLRLTSWCSFAAALIFFIYGFQYLMSVLLAAVLAFVALMLRVAKNMIDQAVELQAENDLTV